MIRLVPMPDLLIPDNPLDVAVCGQCGFQGVLAHDQLQADPCSPQVTVDAGLDLPLRDPPKDPVLQGS